MRIRMQEKDGEIKKQVADIAKKYDLRMREENGEIIIFATE